MNSQSTEAHSVEVVQNGLVTVIKGQKGAGKTTCLLRLFHAHPQGIGFWSRKDWAGEDLVGYTLVDIVTGESRVLCLRADLPAALLPHDFQGSIVQGRFLFDQHVFDWAAARIFKALRPEKIWLDEVGNIEQRGGGFAPVIEYARKNNIPLVMTRREAHGLS